MRTSRSSWLLSGREGSRSSRRERRSAHIPGGSVRPQPHAGSRSVWWQTTRNPRHKPAERLLDVFVRDLAIAVIDSAAACRNGRSSRCATAWILAASRREYFRERTQRFCDGSEPGSRLPFSAPCLNGRIRAVGCPLSSDRSAGQRT